MVADDEPHAVYNLLNAISHSSHARTGVYLHVRRRTQGALLAGSVMALQIAMPPQELTDAYLTRCVAIFGALRPSPANVAAAVEYFALVH